MKKIASWVSGRLLFLLLAAGALAGPATAAPIDPNNFPPFAAGEQAAKQWPEEFAGVWISYVTPPDFNSDGMPDDAKFNFAFTDDAESKVAELRSAYPSSHEYVAHQHEYSLEQLHRIQSEVVADLRSHAEGNLVIPGPDFDWYGAGTYVIQNRVEVTVSAVSPELRQWSLEKFGPMVLFEAGEPIVPLSGRPNQGDFGQGKDPAKTSPNRKLKALVRKCNKAGKKRSVVKKRFSKSKRCQRARRQLRANKA